MWYRQFVTNARIKTAEGIGGGVMSHPATPQSASDQNIPASGQNIPASGQNAPTQSKPSPQAQSKPSPQAVESAAAQWDQAVNQPTIETKNKSLDPRDVNNAYLGGDANTPTMEGYQNRHKSPFHTSPNQTTWEEQLETARHDNMTNPNSPLGGDGNSQSMASVELPDEQTVRGPIQEKSGKGHPMFNGSDSAGDSVVDMPSTQTYV